MKIKFMFLAALMSMTALGTLAPALNVSAASRTYKVLSVIDGDTIKINYNGKVTSVRLIGVDSPEVTSRANTKAGCYASQARTYLSRRLLGKYVSLVSDSLSGDRDWYNRLLRYVYLGGEDINHTLVANGYAREYKFYYNSYRRRNSYLSAQASAKRSGRGLWNTRVCPMNK